MPAFGIYFQLNYYVVGENQPLEIIMKGDFSSYGAVRKWKSGFLDMVKRHQNTNQRGVKKRPKIDEKDKNWPCPRSIPVYQIQSGQPIDIDEVISFAHNNK